MPGAARADAERLAQLVPLGLAHCSTDGGDWVLNPAARRLLQLAPGAADGLDAVLSAFAEEDGAALKALVAAVRAGEEGRRICCRTQGDSPCSVMVDVQPFLNSKGEELGWVMSFSDVSALMQEQDWLAVQLEEMRHRIGNLFALVTGLVQLGPDELAGRVQALAAAHRALDEPQGLPLGELCKAVLQPWWRPGRIEIVDAAADVRLEVKRATPVALVVHELATNAAKHGALAVESGHLKVRVEPLGAGGFRLDWHEQGIGDVAAAGTGFGTRLMQMSVERQLGGWIERKREGQAFHVVVEVPGRGQPTLRR